MYYSDNIKNIMKEWKKEAKVKGHILYRLSHGKNEYDDSTMILTVCTNQPGVMIGKYGQLVDKYRNLINSQLTRDKVFIKIVETDGIV